MGLALALGVCWCLLGAAAAGGLHSLAVLATGIHGEGIDDFTMMAQVDSVRVAHYSSRMREVRPTQAWAAQALSAKYLWEKTQQFWEYEEGSKILTQRWMRLHNQTGGIHTEQVHARCALGDQTPDSSRFQYAYDGQDFISFDNQSGTWVADVPLAFVQKQIWETDNTWTRYVQWFLQEECLQTLRKLMQQGKGVLEQQLAPEVSVSRRDAPHGPVTLSCRASGFHPRPIHLSWVRDGGDVLAETSSSGILPLADGTYHTQSSLEIGPRPDGPRYACRVEHSSLPAPALVWACGRGPLSSGVLATIVLGLAGAAGAGVWLWRRKSAGRH